MVLTVTLRLTPGMPDEGVKLMQENLFVNLADQDEYPSTTLIHNRSSVCAALSEACMSCAQFRC